MTTFRRDVFDANGQQVATVAIVTCGVDSSGNPSSVAPLTGRCSASWQEVGAMGSGYHAILNARDNSRSFASEAAALAEGMATVEYHYRKLTGGRVSVR